MRRASRSVSIPLHEAVLMSHSKRGPRGSIAQVVPLPLETAPISEGSTSLSATSSGTDESNAPPASTIAESKATEKTPEEIREAIFERAVQDAVRHKAEWELRASFDFANGTLHLLLALKVRWSTFL
jgi:hypothetical protein